jgi:transposase InsO family protein
MVAATACSAGPPMPEGGPGPPDGRAAWAMTTCTPRWMTIPGWPTWRSTPTSEGRPRQPSWPVPLGSSPHGVKVQAVMTDNALCYRRSVAFLEAMADLGIFHVPIPPYHPRANGKVERFNRTLAQEWAYIRLYRSNRARLAALPRWLDFYNSRRSHTALGGRPPLTRLKQR